MHARSRTRPFEASRTAIISSMTTSPTTTNDLADNDLADIDLAEVARDIRDALHRL